MNDHTNILASALSCLLESLGHDLANGTKVGEQTLLDIASARNALGQFDGTAEKTFNVPRSILGYDISLTEAQYHLLKQEKSRGFPHGVRCLREITGIGLMESKKVMETNFGD